MEKGRKGRMAHKNKGRLGGGRRERGEYRNKGLTKRSTKEPKVMEGKRGS